MTKSKRFAPAYQNAPQRNASFANMFTSSSAAKMLVKKSSNTRKIWRESRVGAFCTCASAALITKFAKMRTAKKIWTASESYHSFAARIRSAHRLSSSHSSTSSSSASGSSTVDPDWRAPSSPTTSSPPVIVAVAACFRSRSFFLLFLSALRLSTAITIDAIAPD